MILLGDASLILLINIAGSGSINITRHYRISARREWAFVQSTATETNGHRSVAFIARRMCEYRCARFQ